ncbi:MAG: hypothetical protein IJW13_03990 [Clostridia bacterium]|nr:hypothetical protein [Clostridia bacterium]
MEFYKIIAVAILTAILCVFLKSVKSEFFIPILITGGVIVLLFSVEYLARTFNFFQELSSYGAIDGQIFKIVIKITLIAYLIEFAGSLIEDFGLKSLAEKIIFSGKVLLFCMSIPIFEAIAKIITNFLV